MGKHSEEAAFMVSIKVVYGTGPKIINKPTNMNGFLGGHA